MVNKINLLNEKLYFRHGVKPKYNESKDVLNEDVLFQSEVLGSCFWFSKSRDSLSVYTDFGGYGGEKVKDGRFNIKNCNLLDHGFVGFNFDEVGAFVLVEENGKNTLFVKTFKFGAMSNEFEWTPEIYNTSDFKVNVKPGSVVLLDDATVLYEHEDGVMCFYSLESGKETMLKKAEDFEPIKDKLGEIIMYNTKRR